MNILKTLALSAVMAISAASVSAATLIYETGGSAFVELPLADGSLGDFFDDGLDDLDIAVTGQISRGILTLDLLVSDTSGILLESSSVLDATLEAAGGATVVFGSLDGSDSGLFGDTATVIFSFSATDELDGFIEPVTAQIFSDLAAVPLPATLPLLGFAVAGIIATGRRRAA